MGRIAFAQFLPILPNTEPPLPYNGVVEQDNSTRRDFRQPGFKVMPYCLVSVQAINM